MILESTKYLSCSCIKGNIWLLLLCYWGKTLLCNLGIKGPLFLSPPYSPTICAPILCIGDIHQLVSVRVVFFTVLSTSTPCCMDPPGVSITSDRDKPL